MCVLIVYHVNCDSCEFIDRSMQILKVHEGVQVSCVIAASSVRVGERLNASQLLVLA